MTQWLATRLREWLIPLITSIIFFGVLYFLYYELRTIDFRHVVEQALAMPLLQIGLSFLLMLLAYLTLTIYDVLAVRYVGGVLSYAKVAFTAFVAYAVGHNLGFASLSGGAIRYRMYSRAGLSATQIALIILFGLVTFGLGLGLLAGSALLMEPISLWESMGVSPLLVKVAGVSFLLPTFAYYWWALKSKLPLTVKALNIKTPSASIVIGQLIVSAIDLSLAASVLYVLLPVGHGISFIQFLPLFLVAIGLGTLSSIPGGIGVFETVLLLALPELPKETLLSTVLVYRVIYYLIPLLLAVVGFMIHEFMIHRQRLMTITDEMGDWLSNAAPIVSSTIVFIAGSVLLFSGATPSIDARIANLKQFLPLVLLEFSHLLSSVCGILLIIISRGLYKRLKGSLHFTLALLGLGIFASLAKGIYYEEALFLLLTIVVLWSCRHAFYRSSALIDERFTPSWVFSVISIVGISIWIGLISYNHINYSEKLWWQFAFSSDAPRMLRATVVVCTVLIAFLLWKLVHDAGVQKISSEEKVDPALIKEIIKNATDTQANLALLEDKRFLVHPEQDAFIMYQASGNSWITMGDPIGNQAHTEDLAWRFITLCDQHNARPVFYQVSEKYLSTYVDMGMSLSKLGEEAQIDLQKFSLQGATRSDLRQAINRFNKLNATFEVVAAEQVPSILPMLQTISDEWLQAKSTNEKSFSLGAFSASYIMNFDVATITLNGQIIAFVNLWQGAHKEELSLDLMRFSNAAPKGVMDYLFAEVLLWGQAQGYQYFALGMAPLSGLENHPLAPVWHKLGTFIFKHGESFYNFEGLRAYKAKYNPTWRPRYIASTSGLAMPKALMDTSRLISGGILKMFTK